MSCNIWTALYVVQTSVVIKEVVANNRANLEGVTICLVRNKRQTYDFVNRECMIGMLPDIAQAADFLEECFRQFYNALRHCLN
jgi:hypothetical protein